MEAPAVRRPYRLEAAFVAAIGDETSLCGTEILFIGYAYSFA
jgi:hypothetical protein